MTERQERGLPGSGEDFISGYTDPWYYRTPERFQEVRSRLSRLPPEERLHAQKLSFSGYEQERFFYNTGTGAFEEVAGAAGFGRIEDGRSFVRFDYDRDGDEDLLLWNYFRNTLVLLRNEVGQRRKFVSFRLQGKSPNTYGIGATVRVRAGGLRLMRYVNCGEGYLSCHPAEAFFGLGDAAAVEVEVTWPSGAVRKYDKVEAGAGYRLEEESGAIVRLDLPKGAAVPAPPAPRRPVMDGEAIAVAAPLAATPDGVLAFLGSAVEVDELDSLKAAGCKVYVSACDLEDVKKALKDFPRCTVEVIGDPELETVLGAEALLPAVLVAEQGRLKTKFVGVGAGKRAAATVKP